MPYSPDAVIVWCGNNEFLEERKYFTSGLMKVLDEVAVKIRTVQVLKQLFSKPQLDGNELKVTKSFWKKVQQESLDLRSEPELFEKVKIHYRNSLESIAKEGSQNGVKTIFFSVPVNLRDWEPNVSCNTLKGNDSLVWLNSYNTGRANLLKNDYREARDYFISALKNEPLHAHSYFLLARSFDLLNDTLQALEYYSRARDLDYNPFRALTCFNEIVKDIACKNSGAFFYNADSLFKVNSKSGIPGFDLFLDYVHPTRAGNIILAVNFAKYLRLTNILDFTGSGLEIPEQDYEEMLTNYSDEKDEQLQITKFSLFCLTHQYKSAHNLGEWILSNFSQSYLNNNFNQHEVLKLKEGLAAINSYLAEDEALLLGKGNMERMSAAKLMLKNFYAKYYPYGSY